MGIFTSGLASSSPCFICIGVFAYFEKVFFCDLVEDWVYVIALGFFSLIYVCNSKVWFLMMF